MKALVLSNGDYKAYDFCGDIEGYDWIVCADNGMKHARYLQVKPDVIIGDLDSCDTSDLSYFQAQGVRIVQLPAEKDETDTELAIEEAIAHGARVIDVYGGLGTRMDHSLANVQLVYKYLQRGIRVTLYSGFNTLYLVQDYIQLEGVEGDLISLMPFTEQVTGITTKGLAYSLDKGTLKHGDAYGVSNYMCTTQASVQVDSGILIVMRAND